MIKLSKTEARVVRAVQLRADIPLTSISEESGISVATLRQYLRNFVEKGFLRKRVVVNPYVFGHSVFRVYFRTQDGKRGATNALTEDLLGSEYVSHLALVGGSFDYRIELTVPSLIALSKFIDDLFDRHPEVVKRHSVAVLRKKYYLGSKQLDPEKHYEDSIKLQICEPSVELDDSMRSILISIASDSFDSGRTASRSMGMPESTFTYRMSKLQESGVICGQLYSFQDELFGLQAFYLLCLTQSAYPGEAEKFEVFCETYPHIELLWKAMGEWEYEVYVRASSQREIQELCRELYDTFPSLFRDILVIPDFGHLKRSFYPYRS